MTDGILRHSRLGTGIWCLGGRPEVRLEEIAALHYGLEQDITIIDTAELYGGNRPGHLVGRAVKPFTREEVYLVSKVLPANAGRHRLGQSLGTSLRALQTDYLDMYLYHWCGNTPLQEAVDVLETAAAKGKVKSWGVSNFDLEDVRELLEDTDGGDRCRTNQVLYHLGLRGVEVVLKLYQDEHGIPMMAYCPLAQASRLHSGLMDSPAVRQVAQEQGISGCQVLLCSALAQENTMSIPRTNRLVHVKELAACLQIKLSNEQLALLNHVFPVPGRRAPLDMK